MAEEFFEILQQVHNKDCLHGGLKKTFARVCIHDSCQQAPSTRVHRQDRASYVQYITSTFVELLVLLYPFTRVCMYTGLFLVYAWCVKQA